MAYEVIETIQRTGRSAAAVARQRDVSVRSAQRWWQRHRRGEPPVCVRGRKRKSVSREERMALLATMRELGPHVGVEVLKEHHPEAPFRTIEQMKIRWLAVLSRRYVAARKKLAWTRPGHVWAMDFTKLWLRVEGVFEHALLVRDLGSGKLLAATPAPGERPDTVMQTLSKLFCEHGAPLAMKADGGAGFLAEDVKELLSEHGVESLRSPPRMPRYNGSAEAGIRSFKAHLSWQLRRRGETNRITLADLEDVVRRINLVARPRGKRGPNADQLFAQRCRPLEEERAALRAARDRHKSELEMIEIENGDTLMTRSRADAIRRKALERALVENGELKIRRGRIYTPDEIRRGAIYR